LRLLDDHYLGSLFVSRERSRATGDAIADDKHINQFVVGCCHGLTY
jgi:hypothetical protein